MLDRFRRRTARADLNRLRIAHRPFDERFDLRRNGRGKKRCLALARTSFDDAPHVRQKTHVEHAIRFVEHQILHVVELAGALFHVIQQPPRRRDDDIHARFERIHLAAVTDAAENDRDSQIGEPRKIANGRFHLRRQFARRFQHRATRVRGS